MSTGGAPVPAFRDRERQMKILVANLGSTSFKYRLFEMDGEVELARGGVERIGCPEGRGYVTVGGVSREERRPVRDHAEALELCLAMLAGSGGSRFPSLLMGEGKGGSDAGSAPPPQPSPTRGEGVDARSGAQPAGPAIHRVEPTRGEGVDARSGGGAVPSDGRLALGDVAAIGFKAVHGGRVSGVQRVDERVLAAMEEVADVAPAHNPPYVRAMRLLHRRFPQIPLVAAFETGFHATIPDADRLYAVPLEWAEKYGVRRWGFHGASHRYIAQRMSKLLGRRDARIISCHLGGSSSLCAMRAAQSVATSMGMSPQSGLPQNNRAGDFDPFALPLLMRQTGKSLAELLGDLAERSGLLGLSGVSGDVRDLEAAAERGQRHAQSALDVFAASVRHYLGAYLVELGGAEAIVFTGGIGENSARIRAAICRDLQWFGILLDASRNAAASGETLVSADKSRVQLWALPTNEELIVARQVKELVEGGGRRAESGGQRAGNE